jgi:hypothetical protein
VLIDQVRPLPVAENSKCKLVALMMVGGDTNHGGRRDNNHGDQGDHLCSRLMVVRTPTMAFVLPASMAFCSLKEFSKPMPLIFSGRRMDKIPRPMCVGLALRLQDSATLNQHRDRPSAPGFGSWFRLRSTNATNATNATNTGTSALSRGWCPQLPPKISLRHSTL